MATVLGGDKLEAAFARIASKLAKASEVRVGFLEGATYPDGTPVAEVAAIQNFGSTDIPARPFFSNMVSDKSPQWGERFAKVLAAADYDTDLALARMGEGIAGQLRQSIVDTNDPPLARRTVERKGHDKPLVDTGHMLASVDKEVE